MTRLILVFHGRFPSEKAASLFAAESVEAFAKEGAEVTLLVPRRIGRPRTDPHAYYGTERPFSIVYLPTIDLFGLPLFKSVSFRISLFFFSVAVWIFLRLHASREAIVYSNETLPLVIASFVVKTTVYEMHDYPDGWKPYYDFLFDRVRHILVTNHHKLERLAKEFPHAYPQAFYEPNAVALEKYAAAPDRNACRAKLGLPGGPIVVYTGHLYAWKGVDTLAAAVQSLDAEVYIVGGTSRDVAAFSKKWGKLKNMHILGHRPHDEMPLWQKAADVLVLPNTGKEDISVEYTSPMKLFEYMASGTPVVASDLPSIREIAGNGRAVLVTPDDPHALARGIQNVLEHKGVVQSDEAQKWVADHTWEKRAARILKKIG